MAKLHKKIPELRLEVCVHLVAHIQIKPLTPLHLYQPWLDLSFNKTDYCIYKIFTHGSICPDCKGFCKRVSDEVNKPTIQLVQTTTLYVISWLADRLDRHLIHSPLEFNRQGKIGKQLGLSKPAKQNVD